MKKAVIFVRVSRKDQDYTRQIEDLKAVAERKNYEVLEVITEKISGAKKNKQRPAIQKLMSLAGTGAVNVVLCSEVSRLGRNTREVINTFEDLSEAGVSIYFHNMGQETIDANGKRNSMLQMMITIFAEFSRMEREFLIERTLSGLEQAKREGKTLGRPEGTKKSTGSLLEEYSGVVKSLKKGLSIREAAKVNDVATNTVLKVKKAIKQKK